MENACKRCEMHTKFQSENLKGTDYLGDQGIDGNRVWGCGLDSSDRDKRQEIWLAEQLVDVQEGLCSMKLV